MRLDAVTGPRPLHAMGPLAREVQETGFDRLWLFEGGRTAYLACAAVALGAPGLATGTAVAVAFPRSPMVTAQTAWELQEATGGRFVLGLGSQVRAHVERRYSAEFAHPGPRLREYVQSLRAIFRAFRGEEKLAFDGDYYRFSLLPDTWSPGPIAEPDPEIYLAAVNPWMLRMAGEVADGLHVHPLHTARYLDAVVRPNLAAGAARAGRDPSAIGLACPVMTIVGDTDEEIAAGLETARLQIAFYGSTPGYGTVFEVHGWGDLQPRLNRAQRAGDLPAMAAAVTDEVVDAVAVRASWDGLADALRERFGGVATHLIAYFATRDWRPETRERWSAICAQLAD